MAYRRRFDGASVAAWVAALPRREIVLGCDLGVGPVWVCSLPYLNPGHCP